MSMRKEFETMSTPDGLLLCDKKFFGEEESEWVARPIDRSRVILQRKQDALITDQRQGFSRCSVKILKSLMIGFGKEKLSGKVTVDTGRGVKNIFFERGEIVFASSNMIDDRLGEVMYRRGMLNLEQMTSSAVQVTRSKKFGQVLLEERMLDGIVLWKALRSQVQEIIQSIFLVNYVFTRIDESAPPPVTMVRFPFSTSQLIEEHSAQGRVFREFLLRITKDTPVRVSLEQEAQKFMGMGTFQYDFIDLVSQQKMVGQIIKDSKLKDINTYWEIFRMAKAGLIEIDYPPLGHSERLEGEGQVKSLLDAYNLLITQAIDAFRKDGQDFPLESLARFIHDLSSRDVAMINLDQTGQIPSLNRRDLLVECQESEYIKQQVVYLVGSLCSYIVQLSMDSLSNEASETVKTAYEDWVA